MPPPVTAWGRIYVTRTLSRRIYVESIGLILKQLLPSTSHCMQGHQTTVTLDIALIERPSNKGYPRYRIECMAIPLTTFDPALCDIALNDKAIPLTTFVSAYCDIALNAWPSRWQHLIQPCATSHWMQGHPAENIWSSSVRHRIICKAIPLTTFDPALCDIALNDKAIPLKTFHPAMCDIALNARPFRWQHLIQPCATSHWMARPFRWQHLIQPCATSHWMARPFRWQHLTQPCATYSICDTVITMQSIDQGSSIAASQFHTIFRIRHSFELRWFVQAHTDTDDLQYMPYQERIPWTTGILHYSDADGRLFDEMILEDQCTRWKHWVNSLYWWCWSVSCNSYWKQFLRWSQTLDHLRNEGEC